MHRGGTIPAIADYLADEVPVLVLVVNEKYGPGWHVQDGGSRPSIPSTAPPTRSAVSF